MVVAAFKPFRIMHATEHAGKLASREGWGLIVGKIDRAVGGRSAPGITRSPTGGRSAGACFGLHSGVAGPAASVPSGRRIAPVNLLLSGNDSHPPDDGASRPRACRRVPAPTVTRPVPPGLTRPRVLAGQSGPDRDP
jgi:hypothetical protein